VCLGRFQGNVRVVSGNTALTAGYAATNDGFDSETTDSSTAGKYSPCSAGTHTQQSYLGTVSPVTEVDSTA
jgi:hypothetical protein